MYVKNEQHFTNAALDTRHTDSNTLMQKTCDRFVLLYDRQI